MQQVMVVELDFVELAWEPFWVPGFGELPQQQLRLPTVNHPTEMPAHPGQDQQKRVLTSRKPLLQQKLPQLH